LLLLGSLFPAAHHPAPPPLFLLRPVLNLPLHSASEPLLKSQKILCTVFYSTEPKKPFPPRRPALPLLFEFGSSISRNPHASLLDAVCEWYPTLHPPGPPLSPSLITRYELWSFTIQESYPRTTCQVSSYFPLISPLFHRTKFPTRPPPSPLGTLLSLNIPTLKPVSIYIDRILPPLAGFDSLLRPTRCLVGGSLFLSCRFTSSFPRLDLLSPPPLSNFPLLDFFSSICRPVHNNFVFCTPHLVCFSPILRSFHVLGYPSFLFPPCTPLYGKK